MIRKIHILHITSFLLLLLLLIFFHFKGVIFYDEGYILNSAVKVFFGQIPYKDFDVVYTPISFSIVAFGFTLFGISIFTGRLIALFISILSIGALFEIGKLIHQKFLIFVMAAFFFIAWGPSHTNFSWPTMFALCFMLWTSFFYLKGVMQSKNIFFLFAGIFSVLTFFSKQNFGTGAILIAFLSFLFIPIKEKKQSVFNFFYGLCIASGVFMLYFLITNSFIPFLTSIYVNTFLKVIVEKTLNTPFLFVGSIISRIVKLLFYVLPLLLSIFAIMLCVKKNKQLLVIPLFAVTFYLLGIRPTTDYVHIGPLFAGVSPLIFVIYAFLKKQTEKIIFTCFVVGLTVLGLYTAYYTGYYKWQAPLEKATVFVQTSRAGIFATPSDEKQMQEIAEYIDIHTKKSDSIFVNYYAPMIYFIADRNNVSKYDYITSNSIPLEYQQQVVQLLEEKKVKITVMNLQNSNEQTIIAEDIRKHYLLDKQIGDFLFYKRNY